ncbi:hypothetical protein DBZ36_19980 [Alginatibacterium sediminis]|uniref:Zinc ribbon-containing protein n=1 Tax=Alginatibacterium sediminis TaxID=2164068 RepID=A0A420E5N2_9ALTE|nr:hypothetical protein [Alginatibacterium sediminis]RKF12754.1 hypothetical protein DBZ36_19980 [Alginatibacterium sediminis]
MSKFTDVYQQVIKDIGQRLNGENNPSSEELKSLLEKSSQYINAAQELSKDEIELVKVYVKRDIAQWQQDYREDWQASPSMGLLEDSIWHWLGKVSDPSQIAWHDLSEDLKHQGIYKSGERLGLGLIECTKCGYQHAIWHPEKLSPCPKCQHDSYQHLPLDQLFAFESKSVDNQNQ